MYILYVSTTVDREAICFSGPQKGEFVFSSKVWTIFTLGRKTQGNITLRGLIFQKKYIYIIYVVSRKLSRKEMVIRGLCNENTVYIVSISEKRLRRNPLFSHRYNLWSERFLTRLFSINLNVQKSHWLTQSYQIFNWN